MRLSKDANTETNNTEYAKVAQQRNYGNRNTWANMQVILAGNKRVTVTQTVRQ